MLFLFESTGGSQPNAISRLILDFPDLQQAIKAVKHSGILKGQGKFDVRPMGDENHAGVGVVHVSREAPRQRPAAGMGAPPVKPEPPRAAMPHDIQFSGASLEGGEADLIGTVVPPSERNQGMGQR
jgi:hypothetical protein